MERLIGMTQVISRIGPEYVLCPSPHGVVKHQYAIYQRIKTGRNYESIKLVLIRFDGFSVGVLNNTPENVFELLLGEADWIGFIDWSMCGLSVMPSYVHVMSGVKKAMYGDGTRHRITYPAFKLDKPTVQSGRGRDGG
jgi:uncharacterized protein YegJ (DUF2314 family)